jgi:hypothetical protein
MKKIIKIALLILCMSTFFLVILVFKANEKDAVTKEKEWYVQNLNYIFCATINSIENLEQEWGYGYVTCDLDSVIYLDKSKEDSLQPLLKTNRSMRFIVSNSSRTVTLLVPGVSSFKKEDRICVNSLKKEVRVIRNGKLNSTFDILYCLKTDKFD